MLKNDCDLSLRDYWRKHYYEIAHSRQWVCDEACPHRSSGKYSGGRSLQSCAELCSTLRTYDRYMDRLCSFLPPKSISELSFFELRNALRSVQQTKLYASSTMKSYLSMLSDIYGFAQMQGDACNILSFYKRRRSASRENRDIYDLIDPCKNDTEIRNELAEQQAEHIRKPRSLTIKQQQKLASILLDRITSDGRYMALAVMLYAGLRPAEMRGLCWGHIVPFLDHPERHFFALQQIRDKAGQIKERMKTDNAFRKIPVHFELEELLALRRQFIIEHHRKDIGNLPICCYENDFTRPCKDYQYAAFADRIFREINVSQEILESNLLDMLTGHYEGESIRNSADEPLTLYVLRKNFWTNMEACTQLTDFEKRCVMGHAIHQEGRDIRPRYNDEHVLWKIAQKMDNCVVNAELHHKKSVVCLNDDQSEIFVSNAGMSEIHIPREALLSGTVDLFLSSEEANDPIVIDYPAQIKKQMQISAFSIPVSSADTKVGINCEYETFMAAQRHLRGKNKQTR